MVHWMEEEEEEALHHQREEEEEEALHRQREEEEEVLVHWMEEEEEEALHHQREEEEEALHRQREGVAGEAWQRMQAAVAASAVPREAEEGGATAFERSLC